MFDNDPGVHWRIRHFRDEESRNDKGRSQLLVDGNEDAQDANEVVESHARIQNPEVGHHQQIVGEVPTRIQQDQLLQPRIRLPALPRQGEVVVGGEGEGGEAVDEGNHPVPHV
eukprot:CAMPEP_0202966708 /NCGR_PEP_ID=MMETSP1396-20130829/11256_1 /ASSEMBLY_ACC=CAM_ASM_000872 /TAXON_ID= /ORGANISM="Pseudokeronopsis sp., Strain Brazil" /LENGTH=112 /DNA_ID=CAMNT_0049690911 /DNA_START=107 /DNA_END=445 /DNA_ORIENTATION=+